MVNKATKLCLESFCLCHSSFFSFFSFCRKYIILYWRVLYLVGFFFFFFFTNQLPKFSLCEEKILLAS